MVEKYAICFSRYTSFVKSTQINLFKRFSGAQGLESTINFTLLYVAGIHVLIQFSKTTQSREILSITSVMIHKSVSRF